MSPTGSACDLPVAFHSIQAAIRSAKSGDQVVLCPGDYFESIQIGPGKDGLQLRAEIPLKSKIFAPFGVSQIPSILSIHGSRDVIVADLLISGPGDGGCNSLQYGILVDSGAEARIEGNQILDISDMPFSGCQNGIAIAIRGASTPSEAVISGNRISGYQKAGILVEGPGSQAAIRQNEILGEGPVSIIAQNGIQVSGGADATIEGNTIEGHLYLGPDYTATGVLFCNGSDPSADEVASILSANQFGDDQQDVFTSQ